jgi:hypothetical protein
MPPIIQEPSSKLVDEVVSKALEIYPSPIALFIEEMIKEWTKLGSMLETRGGSELETLQEFTQRVLTFGNRWQETLKDLVKNDQLDDETLNSLWHRLVNHPSDQKTTQLLNTYLFSLLTSNYSDLVALL